MRFRPIAQTHQHRAGRAGRARQADDRSRHASTPDRDHQREAQRLFDQGLTLVYGFNHGQAIRLFQRAAELDPRAPMPLWGIALAYGPNINDFEMDRERAKTADEFAKKALALTSAAQPARTRVCRGAVETVLERSERGSQEAPGRLQGRDGGAREGVSVRSRRAGALCGEPDGSPAVAVVDARRAAVGRDRGSRPRARVRPEAQSAPSGRESLLHPHDGSLAGSREGAGGGEAARDAGPGGRPSRPHAGAHLRADRAVRCLGQQQRRGRGRRRALHAADRHAQRDVSADVLQPQRPLRVVRGGDGGAVRAREADRRQADRERDARSSPTCR